MPQPSAPGHITELAELEALFDAVQPASRVKEVGEVHPAYAAMIAASPFVLLATVGSDGLDVSPRGDAPGFVRVIDPHTLHLPERRGNNRIDSLRNIVADPRVALLFLIPGVGETLRVNGRAELHRNADLLARYAVSGNAPKCVLVIRVETVFFQCARAMQRSGLWERAADGRPVGVPTTGAILAALSGGALGGEGYDRTLAERQRATLY
ncbi:MAG: pyridoxamine 5'-phosphate oxidase family protein [Thermoflexales bacterium]|nr:pyridoxamine 5'-phosphate oxidase family protein [Thermoflexales bacterium]